MISILSSPKGFTGIANRIQIAAIRSWLALTPDAEIILYGDAPGTSQAANELAVSHVPDIGHAESGIPLFGAIAAHAAAHARHDLQVYINGDILLYPRFLQVLKTLQFPQFLAIGQRLDLPEASKLNVLEPEWNIVAKEMCDSSQANLHVPGGSDYFAFRRGLWEQLPDVIIGRGCYDNALISHALARRVPVIDLTLDFLALHQFHDYGHLTGGKKQVFGGNEAIANQATIGKKIIPMLSDSTHFCRDGRVHRQFARGDWVRALEISARLVWGSDALGRIIFHSGRAIRRLGLSRQSEIKLPDLVERVFTDLQGSA